MILLLLLLHCSRALAYDGPPLSTGAVAESFLKNLARYETKLASVSEELRDKPVEDWTAAEQQEYLEAAIWLIYEGLLVYDYAFGEPPADNATLRESGIVSLWPANPWNAGLPIDWRVDNLDFHPGDLAWQSCPPGEYSLVSLFPPREEPRSFVLSIFGSAEDYACPYELESPFDWSVIPAGSAFVLSLRHETADETWAKIRKREAEAAEAAAEVEAEQPE